MMRSKKSAQTNVAQLNMGVKTAKLSGFILVSKLISLLVNGLGLIAITRILGPTEYGIYTLALAVAGTIGAFGAFGLDSAILKFVSEQVERHNLQGIRSILLSSTALIFVMTGAFTLLTYAVGPLVAQYVLHNISYSTPIRVASLFILASALYTIATAALISIGRGDYLAWVTLAQSLVQALLGVFLALLGFGAFAPLIGVIVSFFVGFAISVLFAMRFTKHAVGHIAVTGSETRKILSFSFPLGIGGVAANITNNLLSVSLGAIATAAVLGNVGITIRMSGIFELIYGSISQALLPLFSTAQSVNATKKNTAAYYNYSLYTSFLLVMPATMYIVFLAKQFSFVLFSGVYSLAPSYIPVMCLGLLLWIVSTYSGILITSLGKTKQVMKYNIAMMIVQLAMIPLLVDTVGGLGLIATLFVIGPAVGAVLSVRYIVSTLGIEFNFSRLVRVFIAGLISGIFILPLEVLLVNYYIPLLILAFVEQIVLYPVILALTGALRRDDITILGKLTDKLPIANGFMHAMLDYSSRFVRY